MGSGAAPDLIRASHTLPEKVLAQIRHDSTLCLSYNRASPLSMTDLVVLSLAMLGFGNAVVSGSVLFLDAFQPARHSCSHNHLHGTTTSLEVSIPPLQKIVVSLWR